MQLDFKGALDYYLEAERLDPGNALYLIAIGFVYDTLGKYQQAIGYVVKALKIFEAFFGSDHPHTTTVRNNLEISKIFQALFDKK